MKNRVAIGNQPGTVFVVLKDVALGHRRVGSSKREANEIVVKERRAQGELRLLERQESVLIPGCLAKRNKRDRMPLQLPAVGFFRRIQMRKEVSMKKAGSRCAGFESRQP